MLRPCSYQPFLQCRVISLPPCGKECPGSLWLPSKHLVLPPPLWTDYKIKGEAFRLGAGDRGITWPHVLVVKWICISHHFSKSCTRYLWACQVAQAGLKPVAASPPVQTMGELLTMWWGRNQDAQLWQWDPHMNIPSACKQHLSMPWWRRRVPWGRSSASTEHGIVGVWWASTPPLPLTTWFSRNLAFI